MFKKIVLGIMVMGITAASACAWGDTYNYYKYITKNKTENTYVDNNYQNDLSAALAAMSSVELNPDHKGFSVGIGGGFDNFSDNYGAAIGIGYGFDTNATGGYDVGLNMKAYDVEGGNNGVSVGLTVGF